MSALSRAAGALGFEPQPSDEVSIIVGGLRISGWLGVTIRMSVEVMPSTFDLETTEWDPVALANVTVNPGSACTVMIGADTVITGWVVAVTRSIGLAEHSVRITGASKSVDLVECSAEFNTFQINNTNALLLAQALAGKFAAAGDPSPMRVVPVGDLGTIEIQQFDVILTETAHEIMERVCRSAALLCYDDTNGNVILSRAGSTLAASGFCEGVNVERYSCSFSQEGRYSEISAVRQTTDTLYLGPDTEDLGGQVALVTAVGPLRDPGVTRYRPLIIQAEMGDEGNTVTARRVQWEINRRWGRAYAVELTCDSWRDEAGVLWGINTLAPLFLPAGKCTPADRWLIGEVVFRRDEAGTHADVTLMPQAAYEVEPVLLNPLANDVGQAVREQAGAAPDLPGSGVVAQETLAAPGS